MRFSFRLCTLLQTEQMHQSETTLTRLDPVDPDQVYYVISQDEYERRFGHGARPEGEVYQPTTMPMYRPHSRQVGGYLTVNKSSLRGVITMTLREPCCGFESCELVRDSVGMERLCLSHEISSLMRRG